MITREHYIVDTDESHVWMRAALGSGQSVTVRFSKPPTMEQAKLTAKIFNFNGEGAFGKDEWKKKFPEKRKPRTP